MLALLTSCSMQGGIFEGNAGGNKEDSNHEGDSDAGGDDSSQDSTDNGKNEGNTDNGENGGDSDMSGSVVMTAEITELGDKILVTVLESEYTFGPHLVITPDETKYLDKHGMAITRSDLKVGDKVEILYGGQVMMSYPPQIVAAEIRLCDGN